MRSTLAAETCTPTADFEGTMRDECPDKSLLDDISKGWTKHPVGHSKMGKCNCKDESKPDEASVEKGENLMKLLKCRNAELS